MAYDGAGSLFALGVRLTKLDATGAPLVGTLSSYKTDALVQIQLGLEYEDGEEILQRNGSGNLCMYYRAPDTLKQGTIEGFQVCSPDPIVKQFVLGGDLITDTGTAEVQTVTITGGPTGGNFTLTYAGQTTATIVYNAAAAAVQSALEALSNLVPGDVVVTGSAGGPYTVTFNVSLGNVAQMTADGSGLTGGTAPAVGVVTTTPGVAGEELGYRAPSVGTDPTPNGVSVEFWTRAILDGANAVNLPYLHWVVPRARLRLASALEAGAENPMLPEFSGFSTQNPNWGDGPNTGDWPYPSDRVWQYARVATIPDLTPGYTSVA